MKGITNWRVHLGAHKTATTHLQTILDENRGRIRANGVNYVPWEDARLLHLPPPPGRLRWRERFGGWGMRRAFEAALAAHLCDGATLLLSDENWLGLSMALLSETFYPKAGSRVRPLRAVLGRADVELFLAVRRQDDLLASAYAQTLRTRLIPGGFEAIRRRVTSSPPSWVDLIDRLCVALPRARLTLWRFENYIADPIPALSALTGLVDFDLSGVEVPTETRTPSASAIARLERLDPRLRIWEHSAKAATIIAEDRDAEKFQPFTGEERRIFSDIYERDLDTLCSRPDVTVIN